MLLKQQVRQHVTEEGWNKNKPMALSSALNVHIQLPLSGSKVISDKKKTKKTPTITQTGVNVRVICLKKGTHSRVTVSQTTSLR